MNDFINVGGQEPHRVRARSILKENPSMKDLFGRNPWTAAIVVMVVAFQIGLAALLADQPWWLIVSVAWLVGAFAGHALWVLIHECAHNMVFEKKSWNQWLAIAANLPLIVPSAASFCLYHLKHHQYQGEYDRDADLASEWEARLIGNSFFGKFLWECFFPVFQSLRTVRLYRRGGISFFTPWIVLNAVVQLGFDASVYLVLGPKGLVFLLVSLIFSIGPHPLGARWIQEHFVIKPGQETYSYYGSLNTLALNVGFHNEHHDFPFVPWNRLPRVKAASPRWYDSLHSHRSWTGLWIRFLTDPAISLFSRAVRDDGITKESAPGSP